MLIVRGSLRVIYQRNHACDYPDKAAESREQLSLALVECRKEVDRSFRVSSRRIGLTRKDPRPEPLHFCVRHEAASVKEVRDPMIIQLLRLSLRVEVMERLSGY